MSFWENPFQEGGLSFAFESSVGATRYETWSSHLHVFQQRGMKAVDFIFPLSDSSQLFFTEVKDFQRITREGKYKRGDYSLTLANDTAKKFVDSFSGYNDILNCCENDDEHAFVSSTKAYEKIVVFHWEFNPEFPRQKRLHDMKTMKAKLRELLEGICSRINIESIDVHPSKNWTVTRIGDE